MKIADHIKEVEAGIKWLHESLGPLSGIDPARCVTHLENGTGDAWACKSTLERFCIINSMLAWFESRDLAAAKHWTSNAARLRRGMYHGGEGVQCGQEAPATATLEAWQADDYALLKETAQRNADACVAKFVEVLPALFPDRAPVAAVEQGV